MELRNKIIIYIAVVFAVVMIILYFLLKKKNKSYSGGEKIYGMAHLKDNSYLKRKKIIYKLFSVVILITALLGVVSGGVLLARPYEAEVKQEEKYSRDIMLCLDISYSVDKLNKNLVEELIQIVERLKGERIGIIIFNTSPVLLSPLTDDYEYIIEQLNNLSKGLEVRMKYDEYGILDDDYFYWDQFISGGTLINNEERGSSLVGDGLAASVCHFSSKEEKRTRIAILTSDNDVYGEEIFDLPEAASLCKDNRVIVYGIGTEEMEPENMREMKSSVEMTGGKFYIEEESGSVFDIVDDIQSQSKSKIKGKKYLIETDQPQTAFVVLLLSVSVMFLSIKIIKK